MVPTKKTAHKSTSGHTSREHLPAKAESKSAN